MSLTDIEIRSAREHNLDDVSLILPRNKLICFTGVSGSGKSSLAFDTLYAEGQRRYIESLSSYARQFLDRLPKPQVDSITGLAPAISISQKTAGQNTRSTVGTITEIHDFLRVLYARVSTGYCPKCGKAVTAQTRGQILDRLDLIPNGTRFLVLAPLIRGQKGEYRDLFADLKKRGFLRARADGRLVRLEDDLKLDRQMRHTIEVVVDRIEKSADGHNRLAEAVESALSLGKGKMIVCFDTGDNTRSAAQSDSASNDSASSEPVKPKEKSKKKKSTEAEPVPAEMFFSSEYACAECGISFEPPTPQLFSFNSPQGMCPACQGLGFIHTFDEKLLIPDPSRSFQQGCIVPIGKWKELGRWKRHIFQGVADTLAKRDGLEKNHLLETAWEELDPKYRDAILYGTGDLHITFTWRNGPSGHKWGGPFEGIIPKMLSQYRQTESKLQRLAMEKYMSVTRCGVCKGARLNEQARSYKLETESDAAVFKDKKRFTITELSTLAVCDLLPFFERLKLTDTQKIIARQAVKEITARLGFLRNVGLDYLSLSRTAPTLSGGETQRIRLAGQIGSALSGVLYVLDEPSIGLHSRDNKRLIETLRNLRDIGNTVVVVEHDEETMRAADYLVDFGPGPGVHGGEVVAAGPVADVLAAKSESVTARYLRGEESIPVPAVRKKIGDRKLIVRGATHNNLKNIDVEIPLGGIVCVTGVSGSGKSSLVNDILVEALNRDLNRGIGSPGSHRSIEGLEHLDKLIAIDQSPIGRTPRSNPATYIKLFDDIRKLFSELPEAKAKGFAPGRFSFNVAGGRCEACEGNGSQRLEMDFLADIWVTCPVCEGHRFNRDTLSVTFKGRSIDRILDLEVQEALELFEHFPKIAHKLRTLYDVGLGYMKLGQPSPTLSGGEAQRIKLARELVKKGTGKTLYLLDEPTTGLHFADIKLLLSVLKNFADAGNTVLIVEHNLDVIKTADWIIDLGPEGGAAGGEIVAVGTPEEVIKNPASHTGKALAEHLAAHTPAAMKQAASKNTKRKKAAVCSESSEAFDVQETERAEKLIIVEGARQHNLQNVSVEIPRFQTTVCSGPSGSGKSSLAMDTVYAEGQRRYVESLSSYARQFLGQMQKADVDRVSGISPAVAIEQKGASRSPRSTVGTTTEIQDYLRVLYARLGTAYCPDCNIPVGTQSTDEIVLKVLGLLETGPALIAAPIVLEVGTDCDKLWSKLRGDGFLRVRIDKAIYRLDDVPAIDRRRRHTVEVVIDRIRPNESSAGRKLRSRVAGSVEHGLDVGRGEIVVVAMDEALSPENWSETRLSQHLSCSHCGRSFERLSAHHFSFNSPLGWCPHCEGLGVETGASPTHYLRDPKRTLAEGALLFCPAEADSLTRSMLETFCRETQIPTDVPFDQLDARCRRLIFHGTLNRRFDVKTDGGKSGRTLFSFEYKGIFPAIEEAQRLVPAYRSRFEFGVEETECSVCCGSRLRDDAAAVRFHDLTLDRMGRLPLGELLDFFEQFRPDEREKKIAGDIVTAVRERLRFLVEVGLDYLTLARPAASLSGGESQRIRLAGQIGSGLTGVLYVLDEPTIGLHPRDNARLIGAIKKLRDLGNTVLMVEHDRQVIESADHLLDFGPKAGKFGGRVVASGSPSEVAKNSESVTGPYLAGTRAIPVPINRRILP